MIPVDLITEYTKNQKEMISDLSQVVTVGLNDEIVEDCPNCASDSMADVSAGIYSAFSGTITVFSGTAYAREITAIPFRNICPICRGKGELSIPNEVTINAMVRWDFWREPDTIVQSSAGGGGQMRARIKSDSANYSTVWNARYFIVNGVKLYPLTPPAIRGMGSANGIVEIYAATNEADRTTGV